MIKKTIFFKTCFSFGVNGVMEIQNLLVQSTLCLLSESIKTDNKQFY